MDWLNENELRSYPFVDGSAMDGYPSAIVDAVFSLGTDIPFDFDNDTAELRLTTVVVSGAGHQLFFQYFVNGIQTGATLLFVVPLGSPMHKVIRADTGLSHGYITLGDIAALPMGAYGAAVEARTITPILGASAVSVSVYNAVRRGSYVPYVPDTPGLTPAQVYAQAKAAAPSWQPNQVLDPVAGVLSGGLVVLEGGFNVSMAPEISTNTAVFSLVLNGPGSGCRIVGYVESKLGTSDPVADIDGDGTVTANDVILAGTLLTITPQEISVTGVLRSINGVPAKDGDIALAAGAGVTLGTQQDTYAVLLNLQPLSLPSRCV